jgi:hypothetical protein
MQATTSLQDWHDFYVLVGTAAGTLIGLTFVAASIGSGLFTDAHKDMMKAFITPTVIHFCAVLFVCFLVTVPSVSSITLGSFSSLIALIGVGYSCGTWLRMRKRYSSTTSFADRLWYALVPTGGYLILATAALEPLIRSSLVHSAWIAVALCILLLAGIRNAWAMTLWIAVQPGRK